jgi:hypothetical protein
VDRVRQGKKMAALWIAIPTEDDLILVFSRRCGWQTDIDTDDTFPTLEGRYHRIAGKATEVATPDDKLAKLKSKLEACEKQHVKLATVSIKLDADKAAIVKRLGEMGIKSKDDLKGNKTAQFLAKELAELSQERESIRKNFEEIGFKVTQIGSLLRRLERQASMEGTAISEKELDEMLIDLNDKIDSEQPKAVQSIEVGEILDKELKK